jgi:undecaprenyl-diphosphatase
MRAPTTHPPATRSAPESDPGEVEVPDAGEDRGNGVVLATAGLVGAISLVVVAFLTLQVHFNVGFARDDSPVLQRVRYHSSSRLIEGAQALVRLGNVETLIIIAIAIGFLLRVRGLRLVLCAAPLASLLVAGAFVTIMKATIGRTGPLEQFQFVASDRGSFPSGHSADTMSLGIGLAIVLGAVLFRRPAERVIVFGFALAFSTAVGISTLVLGVHWPTDVVAGWAVGLGAAVAVATLAVLATRDEPLAAARVRPRHLR